MADSQEGQESQETTTTTTTTSGKGPKVKTGVSRLEEENRELRRSMRKDQERRKKRLSKDASIPDVSNSLSAYTTLPATADAFDSKGNYTGWEFRSRQTASTVMDSHKAASLDSDNCKAKSHTRRSGGGKRRGSKPKQPQQNGASLDRRPAPEAQGASGDGGEGKATQPGQQDDASPQEKLDLFVLGRFDAIMDAYTMKDSGCKGELPCQTMAEVVCAMPGCPVDAEAARATMPDGDEPVDYANYLSARKAGGVRASNRKRIRGGSPPKALVVKTKLPSEITVADVKTARADLAKAQAASRKQKQKDEFEKTKEDLSKMRFDQISGTSKDNLTDAYLTYSAAPQAAKRAMKTMTGTKTKNRS